MPPTRSRSRSYPSPSKSVERGRPKTRSRSRMDMTPNPRSLSRMRKSVKFALPSTGPGKSGGFLAKKTYDRSKVKEKNIICRKGASYQKETGVVVQGQGIAVVGHATAPENYVSTVLGMCLLKLITTKHYNQVAGTLTSTCVGGSNYQLGDVFGVVIANRETGVITASVAHTVAAGSTYLDIVNGFKTQINAVYSSTEISICGIYFSPNAATIISQGKDKLDINLSAAKFTLMSKSTLKIQNQTVVGTDSSIEEVNNQPLHGRFYETNGTYIQARKISSTPVAWCCTRADGAFGVGYDRGGGGVADFREPPGPTFFSSVKRTGKDSINPGEVKTSTLESIETVSFDRMQKYFNTTNGSASSTNGGKSRYFAFERMVDAENDSTNIRLACEWDAKLSGMIVLKNQTYWAPFNDTKTFVL